MLKWRKTMLDRQSLGIVLVVALLAGAISSFAAISSYVDSSSSTVEDTVAPPSSILQDPIQDCFTDRNEYVYCRS